MSLVFFNIKVTWATITNDVRVSVYNPLDLNTPIASQQQNAPHLDQQFSFPGLPRQNFVYKVLEAEINGSTVLSQLGQASFVPADDGIEYFKPVLIEVDASYIPGSGDETTASTIETNYLGNPSSSSAAFTLKGAVQPDATVQVDFSWDDGDGMQSNSVTSIVLSGWDMSDLVADLLSQIVAINVNALPYTDIDSFTGVRVRGLTTASVNVTITNTTSGSTPLIWASGVNTVNIPGWIGRELEASGRPGQYPFKRDEINQIDISWDPTTGDLTLLAEGDQFQSGEFLYFEFQPVISQSSGGIPPSSSGGSGFSGILLVTTNTTLTESDIGKKILIDPDSTYLEITLPDYTAIEANRITFFEMVSSSAKCALIKASSGQDISWLNGNNLYICPSESLEMYKRVVSAGVYQWRVQNESGNFRDVGEFTFHDNGEGNVYSLNGGNTDYLQYARLYDWVTRHPSVIAYASWSGSNIYSRMKFSLKDTASGNFRVPDFNTTPIYLRPKGVQGVTDYISASLLEHQHIASSNTSSAKSVGAWGYYHLQVSHIGKYTGESTYYPDMTSRAYRFDVALGIWLSVDGTDNNPNSRATNVYIKF